MSTMRRRDDAATTRKAVPDSDPGQAPVIPEKAGF
jgi:hypothetical protein